MRIRITLSSPLNALFPISCLILLLYGFELLSLSLLFHPRVTKGGEKLSLFLSILPFSKCFSLLKLVESWCTYLLEISKPKILLLRQQELIETYQCFYRVQAKNNSLLETYFNHMIVSYKTLWWFFHYFKFVLFVISDFIMAVLVELLAS